MKLCDAVESIVDQKLRPGHYTRCVISYLCDHGQATSLLSLFVCKMRHVEEVIPKVIPDLSFCKYSFRLLSSSHLEEF